MHLAYLEILEKSWIMNQRIRYGLGLNKSYVQIIKWLFLFKIKIGFICNTFWNSLTKDDLKDNCIQKYFAYKIYMHIYFIYKIL